MSNKSIPTPVIVAVVVVVLAVISFFAYRAFGPASTGGNYTPGVPPWKDPKVGGAAGPAPPAIGSSSTTAGQGSPAGHPSQ